MVRLTPTDLLHAPQALGRAGTTALLIPRQIFDRSGVQQSAGFGECLTLCFDLVECGGEFLNSQSTVGWQQSNTACVSSASTAPRTEITRIYYYKP